MSRYYYDDRPGAPLAGVSAVAFLILAGATGTAFFAVSEGVFEPAPSASLYAFSPEAVAAPAPDLPANAAVGQAVPAAETAAPGLDLVQTSALEPEAVESPMCDVQACASAYRSFRASDCSFQPFDGPRRLCTR